MGQNKEMTKEQTDDCFKGLPTHLYRYRPFAQPDLDDLCDNKIFFPSPKTFNDPFDCKSDFSTEDCTAEEIRKHYENSGRPNFKEEMRAALDNPEGHWENVKKAAKDCLQPEIDEMGVLSFSEQNDDILMWSHYADKHRGFCLEFDTNIIFKPWKLDDSIVYCDHVVYDNKYPSYKEIAHGSILEDPLKSIQFFILKKSEHWKYECEWRAMFKPAGQSYSYPEEMLTAIIFGLNMSPKNREKLADCLKGKKHKPRLYEARKKKGEFGLEIRELLEVK